MSPDQLRTALKELNGERDCTLAFTYMNEHASLLQVHNAMLIPDEPDHLVKVTDGKNIYLVDAERVAWVRISLKKHV